MIHAYYHSYQDEYFLRKLMINQSGKYLIIMTYTIQLNKKIINQNFKKRCYSFN